MKIYLSSTYTDLLGCREAVYKVLRMMRHDVIAMEDYGATDRRPLDKCLDDVARTDLYLGIFAWRYGYVPERDNPEERSITELEFRQARDLGKPCLLFLLHEDAPWPRSYIDRGTAIDQVDALRDELRREYAVQFFTTADDLAKRVAASLAIQQAESDLREASNAKGRRDDIAEAAAALRRTGPVPRVTALWVDDNPDGNIHENIMLSSLGLEITQTTSTQAAWTYMGRKHFDVVLTDLGRGGDPDAGLKLIEEIRKTDAATPIVVYTPKPGGRAETARTLGADAVANTPGELLTSVLQVCPTRLAQPSL